MGSSKKTITDLQIVDLLEPGTAEAEGRRQSIMRSGGKIELYSAVYTAFKKGYRKKVSSVFLSNIGYNPNTVAQTRVLDKSAVKSYLIGKSINVDEIIVLRGTYLAAYATAGHYLQENYAYTNHTETLLYSGKTYKSLEVTNGGSTLNIRMSQWYLEAIENRLNVYNYDGTNIWRPTGVKTITTTGTAGVTVNTILVEMYNVSSVLVYTETVDVSVNKAWSVTSSELANGDYTVVVKEDGVQVSSTEAQVDSLEMYSVDVIIGAVVDNGGVPSYKVDTNLSVSPFTLITEYIPVEYFLRSTPEYSYEVMYTTYTLIGGAIDEWFSYVENLDTIPSNLYVLATINMTAILPLKENNSIYDLEEKRRKQLLRRVGIEPKDMVESLADPNLDNAYLWTGLPLSNIDPASIKVMFKTFDYLAAGSGNISVSMSQLSMNYNFTIAKSTYTGKIMNVGEYSKSLVGADVPGSSDENGSTPATYSTLTLLYQGSETEWRQIVITNYVNSYSISGHSFTAFLTSSKDVARLIIPLDVLNGLRYREYVTVFESSLSMICYSITVVKTKWYQTGIFKIFVLIVMIIIAIYTGYFDPQAFATAIGSMTATELVTAAIISIGVSVGIQLILKALGPEMGALVAIIAIVALAYGGYLNMNLNNFNGYLATATNVLSTMDQAIQMKTNEIMVKGKEELDAIAEKSEQVQELMENMRSLDGGMAYMINGFDDTAASSTMPTVDSYYTNMLGGVAFNFDVMYDVDGAIMKRKVVNSG